MGYRSEIRIIVTKEGFEKLKEYVVDYLNNNMKKDDDIELCNLLNYCDVKYEHETYVYFGWDGLKWYEGDYIDVDAIMKGLYRLAANDYTYRYARIGENYDDIDEKWYDSQELDKGSADLDFPYIVREFCDGQYE